MMQNSHFSRTTVRDEGTAGTVPSQQPNMTTTQFFRELYGDCPEDLQFLLWRKDRKLPLLVPLHRLEVVLSTNLAGKMVPDLYFGVGLQRQDRVLQGSKRGTERDVVALPGLWMDLDCDQGSESKNLPTRERALQFLDWLPFGSPSILVNSGGGFHAYFLFREPLFIRSSSDLAYAKALSHGFQSAVIGWGNRHGYALDLTADLARVLRVPGTVNLKTDQPRSVEIVRCSPIRYDPVDFLPYLPKISTSYRPNQGRSPAVNPGSDNFEIAYRNCHWLQHCWTDAAALKEPEWWGLITLLSRCEDGERLAHEISKPCPGYSWQETAGKYDQALKLPNPYGCKKIGDMTASAYCSGCPYQGKITSPLDIAWVLEAREMQQKSRRKMNER